MSKAKWFADPTRSTVLSIWTLYAKSRHIIKPRTLIQFPLCPRTMVDLRRLLCSAGPDKGRERTKQPECLSPQRHWKSCQKVTPPWLCGLRGVIPPVLNCHIGSPSPEGFPRLTQMVFRKATPASGSAGQWPKAVAHSMAMASAGTPGIGGRDMTPACDGGGEHELISSPQHRALLRQPACCRDRLHWLRQGKLGKGLTKATTFALLLDFPLVSHSELSCTEFWRHFKCKCIYISNHNITRVTQEAFHEHWAPSQAQSTGTAGPFNPSSHLLLLGWHWWSCPGPVQLW